MIGTPYHATIPQEVICASAKYSKASGIQRLPARSPTDTTVWHDAIRRRSEAMPPLPYLLI